MKKSAILKNYIRFTILIVLIFLANDLNAQKKISLDVNAGVLHSVGKDILKTYRSNIQPLQGEYFSKKKFEHPYFNLLANVNYPVNVKIAFGLQTGIYVHFLERYFSNLQRTTVSIPLMATFRYNVMDIKMNQLGINLAGGMNFFDINISESHYRIKNGTLFNASVFYINKKSIIKLGVEKEVDNVSFYFIASSPYTQNETFRNHLNRLSVLLSYGFILKK